MADGLKSLEILLADDEPLARVSLRIALEQIMLEASRAISLGLTNLFSELASRTPPPRRPGNGTATGSSPYLERLTIDSGQRLILVEVNEVDWIEVWGDYVRLRCSTVTMS
jgi:hypothetical protein